MTLAEEAASEPESLLVEVDAGIVTLTLNRPNALNALDRDLKAALLRAIGRIARDSSIRVVILTGAGRAFCAGQDLREAGGPGPTDFATLLRETYHPIILGLRGLEQPVIGAINGVAAGAGASLAFACDLRVAADGASFILAFGRLALIPDSGATWFLPRLVGPARAAELAFTTDPIGAAEAERIGLVNRVVPGDTLGDETRALAGRLSSAAPRALGLTKRALNRSLDMGLEEALEYEATLQGLAGRTADHAEGVRAFTDKRPPRFSGT
ncbi:MAG TPA: enoyl-CoA hydratase-related protein [Candidatus Limnocylindrales bacterium]|nr:enoyl-CoA hydratase-related protein [Candidatus Limnocylindrales bacterium]